MRVGEKVGWGGNTTIQRRGFRGNQVHPHKQTHGVLSCLLSPRLFYPTLTMCHLSHFFLVSWVELARDDGGGVCACMGLEGGAVGRGGREGAAANANLHLGIAPPIFFCPLEQATVSNRGQVWVWLSGLMRCGVSPGESRSSLKPPRL